MYALARGVKGLSSGTRVQLLSWPNIEPVRVRTLSPLPRYQERTWIDHNGQKHREQVEIKREYVEVEVPIDWLVALRPNTRES